MQAPKSSTRERLLQVAEEQFARNGFAGTSFRDLGAAVGIANASITYHFPSKRKLYAAVLSRVAESVQRVTADLAAEGSDPVERIRLMVDRVAAWGEANPGYMQLIVRELMENPGRISRVRTLHLKSVVEALRLPIDQARQHGYLRDFDPELFLLHLIGSISYFTIAVPTVGRITDSPDLDALRSRFRASLHHIVTACVNRSSVRGSSSSMR
jgi:AcrR family transcriptional regulator